MPVRSSSWAVWALSLLLLLLPACSDPEAGVAELQTDMGQRGRELGAYLLDSDGRTAVQEGLTVRLAFGAEADLDVYVTGPLLETVYFANQSSRSGGQILEDLRCDEEQVKVEEVRFDAPIPGRYRVGIDYPNACAEGNRESPYAVSVQHDGKRWEASGTVSLHRFEIVVLDVEIE